MLIMIVMTKDCKGCHCYSCIWRYSPDRCLVCYPDEDACDKLISEYFTAHERAKMEAFKHSKESHA